MARTAAADRNTEKKPSVAVIDVSHHSATDKTSEIGSLLAAELHIGIPAKFAVFILGKDGQQRCVASPDASVRTSISTIVFEELGVSSIQRKGALKSIQASPTSAVFDPSSMNHSPAHADKRRQSRSNPIGKPTSQRRSMMSRRSRARAMPLAIRDTVDGVERDAVDDLPMPERSYGIDVSDEAKVIKFMFDRLGKIQQVSNKHIAKEWIKRICPRKQTLYPYTKDSTRLPPAPWWPDVERCKYLEPDHINKEEREELLVHLLRLRPTPEEMDEWNQESENDARRGREIHVREGWTRFLQGVIAIEDMVSKSDTAERIEQRRQWLEDLFSIAAMEESWKRYGQANHYVVLNEDRNGEAELDIAKPDPAASKKQSAKRKQPTERKRHTKRKHASAAARQLSPVGCEEQQTLRTAFEHSSLIPVSEEAPSDLAYDSAVEMKNPVTPSTTAFPRPAQDIDDMCEEWRASQRGWPCLSPSETHQHQSAWPTPSTSAPASFHDPAASDHRATDFDTSRFRTEHWISQPRHEEAYAGFQPTMYQDARAHAAPYNSGHQLNAMPPTPFFHSSHEAQQPFPTAFAPTLPPETPVDFDYQSTMLQPSMLPWDLSHQPVQDVPATSYAWRTSELPYHIAQQVVQN